MRARQECGGGRSRVEAKIMLVCGCLDTGQDVSYTEFMFKAFRRLMVSSKHIKLVLNELEAVGSLASCRRLRPTPLVLLMAMGVELFRRQVLCGETPVLSLQM